MNANPLDKLRDVHMPAEPSLWPPALGFILLGSVFLAIVIVIAGLWWRGRKSRSMKRSIAAEMLRIESEFMANNDAAQLQNQLSALLFRVFITKYPREKKSPIDLDRIIDDLFNRSAKSQSFYQQLVESRFKKDPGIDAQALMTLAKEQFNKCRL